METKSRVGILSLLVAASSLQLAACAATPESEDADVSVAEQGIIRGTVIANETARNSGVVYVTAGSWACTGTLLSADWVITGAHCFPAAYDVNNDGEIDAANLSQINIRQGSPQDAGARVIGVNRVVRHPNTPWETANAFDVALVRLSSTADVASLPTNFFRNGRLAIFTEANSAAVNGNANLFGYGANTGHVENGVFVDVTGNGPFRTSTLPITAFNTVSLGITAAVGTGNAAPGDSGGPSFFDDYESGGVLRARYLVGVNVRASGDSTPGSTTAVGAAAFRNWVQTTAFGAVSPVSFACSGTSCSTAPSSLPDNVSWLGAYAPRTANPNNCYHVTATYNMENTYDFAKIADTTLTGSGTFSTHYCGVLPVYITTDYSVASGGVSLAVSNFSTRPNVSDTCGGTSGQWDGCRGNGCAVCMEVTREYPKYFVNHPACAVNTNCAGETYTCNSNCPAPTAADK